MQQRQKREDDDGLSLSPLLSSALSILPSFTVHRTAGSQEESWRGHGGRGASGRSVGRSDGQGKKELVYLHDFPALSWVHALARWDRQIEEERGEGERDRESAKKERAERSNLAPRQVHVLEK